MLMCVCVPRLVQYFLSTRTFFFTGNSLLRLYSPCKKEKVSRPFPLDCFLPFPFFRLFTNTLRFATHVANFGKSLCKYVENKYIFVCLHFPTLSVKLCRCVCVCLNSPRTLVSASTRASVSSVFVCLQVCLCRPLLYYPVLGMRGKTKTK